MDAILDTSMLVAAESGRLSQDSFPPSAGISSVTVEELRLGVLRATPRDRSARETTYDAVTRAYSLVPVTREIADLSAEIRSEGRSRGRRYGLADALIGATARHLALPVYTQDAGFEGMVGVDVHMV